MSLESEEWSERSIKLLKERLADVTKERDELRTQLDAWHSVFETSQLSHAQARLEQAEKDAKMLSERENREECDKLYFKGLAASCRLGCPPPIPPPWRRKSEAQAAAKSPKGISCSSLD